MRDKTLRTFGALAVLVGLAVAGLAQLNMDRYEGPLEIDVSETRPNATEPRAEDEPVSTTAAEPEHFVYRMGVLAGITTDNFWAFYGEQPSVWNSYVLGPTKPSLLTLDSSQGALRPELSLAQSIPVRDAEGWRVRLELAQDFKWSDGTPITADDFVFTFETVRALGLAGSWAESFPAVVESVHADGDYQLRIEFSERPTLAVWPHGVGLAPVMARHVWESHVEGATAETLYALPGEDDVSGGPLTLTVAWANLMVSKANPGYPDGATPDTVEYVVFPDEDAAVAAVAAGEIDAVLTPTGLAPEHLTQLEADPNVAMMASPANSVRYLGFNLERDPMSDHAFRAALALLLDRQSLSETIPQTGAPATALVPEENTQWFDAEVAQQNEARYEGDPATRLATALDGLRNVGYTWSKEPAIGEGGEIVGGEGLKVRGQPPQRLTILTAGDEYDTARPQYVEEIANTLALLGFEVIPVETDFDTVVDLAFTPDEEGNLHYDMYMLGWTLGNPALPGYYRPLFAADGVMNNTGYSSEVFERALADYEQALTTESAKKALWQMEQTLAADLPYLLLYTPQITEIFRSDRVSFDLEDRLGGLQARLGGIGEVREVDATLAR